MTSLDCLHPAMPEAVPLGFSVTRADKFPFKKIKAVWVENDYLQPHSTFIECRACQGWAMSHVSAAEPITVTKI